MATHAAPSRPHVAPSHRSSSLEGLDLVAIPAQPVSPFLEAIMGIHVIADLLRFRFLMDPALMSGASQ